MNIWYYANPERFAGLARTLLPWTLGLALILAAIGTVWGLLIAPPDYQQGEAMRIIYVHVPAAWMAMFVYAVMAVSSAIAFIWNHPLADVAAKASAPIGAVFTALALVTGMLWGEPMWGTWWVWDARLTSVLILFFLYIGYIVLWSAIEEPARAARAARILALVGAVNLPIIKFSVDWWNTLHQPASVFRMDGPTMAPEMLTPLLIMGLAYNLLYVAILFMRMRAEIAERRLRTIRLGLEPAAS
ncbi:MAG: heme ABC transporter permease [Alphaproteobacteria bacterium]|nr:heme ABC transporter permease [Alphaproteobacteria bacterium]